MKTINYKSDFSIIEKFKCKDYKLVPFKFTYYTKSINHPYIAEYRIEDNNPKYINCEILPNGNIKVVFQEHNLGAGYLKAKREFFISDDSFEDGICHYISDEDLDIFLEKGVPNDKTDKVFDTEIQAYYVTLEVGNSDDFSRDSNGNLIISNKFRNSKQDKLISGTNIKTINGNSLLGNGNIIITGGGGGSGGYEPPVGGIPRADLSQEVQTSLGKADTALQDAFAENLLLNARFSNNAEKWEGGNYQVVNDIHGRGVSGVKLWDDGYVIQNVDAEEGYYTLSFWHTGLSGENYVSIPSDCEDFESDLGEVRGGGEYILPNNDTPKKYTIRFYSHDDVLTVAFEAGGEMSISEVKLEKSKKASDFSLNTLDVADKYSVPTKDEVATAIANAITNTLNTEV